MGGVESVEQGALELEAARLIVLPLDVAAQGILQGGEVSEAQALGQGVVDLGLLGRAHFLDRDPEDAGLFPQGLDRIVGREDDGDRALLARGGAGELVLEAGEELTRAQDDLGIARRPALEGLPVDLADEIDDHLIAVARLRRLARPRLVGAVLRC